MTPEPGIERQLDGIEKAGRYLLQSLLSIPKVLEL